MKGRERLTRSIRLLEIAYSISCLLRNPPTEIIGVDVSFFALIAKFKLHLVGLVLLFIGFYLAMKKGMKPQ